VRTPSRQIDRSSRARAIGPDAGPEPSEQKNRGTVLITLGLVFILKLVVLLQLRDHPLTQPDAGLDTTAYAQLARSVLDGNLGLGPGVYYVSPFYIYFLAAGLALFKSFTAVRVVQIALGTASVGFLFFTARAWFGQRAAWIAMGLAAFTGLFTFYEVLILQASLDAFLTSAALYFLTRGLLADLPGLFVAGLIFGVQTLNRPNIMLAALGVALVMLLVTPRRGSGQARRVNPAAVLVAGLVLGMAPAAIRNAVVAHQWSFVSSHGGLNFYIGNSERATGFYQIIPGVTPTISGQEKDVRAVAERALGHPVTDAEASDYFVGLSRAWITGHPADALTLFAKKFYYTFNAVHVALPHSYPFYAHDAGTALRFYAVGPWLLVPLGLVGLAVGLRRRHGGPPSPRGGFGETDQTRARAYLVWVSFVPAYAAAVALFFVAERYRLPLLVPLCAGSGAAIDLAMRGAAARRWTALALGTAAVATLGLATNWPLQVDEGRWLEGLRTAQQLVLLGRYDEADRWAIRLDENAAVSPPRPGAGRYGVGAQLLALNQPQRALPYFEAAFRADPSNAPGEYALGQALVKVGRVTDSVPHLRRGFEAGIELPQGGYDLADALHAAGDFPAAAAVIRRITPAASDNEEAWLRLGRLAAEVKAPDVAEPFFEHAVRMRPGLAAARQQFGLNLLVLGKLDEAARELAEAARIDPRDPDSLSHLAYCEYRLGRTVDARTHALAALALNPADELAEGIIRAGGS
jgi:tetratricopeptide (TPR) repeat protein